MCAHMGVLGRKGEKKNILEELTPKQLHPQEAALPFSRALTVFLCLEYRPKNRNLYLVCLLLYPSCLGWHHYTQEGLHKYLLNKHILGNNSSFPSFGTDSCSVPCCSFVLLCPIQFGYMKQNESFRHCLLSWFKRSMWSFREIWESVLHSKSLTWCQTQCKVLFSASRKVCWHSWYRFLTTCLLIYPLTAHF